MITGIPKTMKAAVLTGPGRLEVREAPVPEPGPEDVLIRVEACAVCPSDVSLIRSPWPGQPPYGTFVVGHEYAGTVAAVGSTVDEVREGDRVAVEVHVGCTRCANCRQGNYTACLNWGLAGKGHRANGMTSNGGFAQYVVNHVSTVHKVPDRVSFEEASLLTNLGCVLYGFELFGGYVLGEEMAIIGEGPLGLISVRVAKFLGADHVTLLGMDDHRLELGRKMGADRIIDVRREDPLRILKPGVNRGGRCCHRGLRLQGRAEAGGTPSKVDRKGAPPRHTGGRGRHRFPRFRPGQQVPVHRAGRRLVELPERGFAPPPGRRRSEAFRDPHLPAGGDRRSLPDPRRKKGERPQGLGEAERRAGTGTALTPPPPAHRRGRDRFKGLAAARFRGRPGTPLTGNVRREGGGVMARVYFQRARPGYRAVRGEVIRLVQDALRAAGADPGDGDGIYGGDTEGAVEAFQRRQGFDADGRLTDKTWTSLMGEAPPALLDRCLQLTGDFEGHGFGKVAGNFDGAGLTWGIIGFTLEHGEVQKILAEVRRTCPERLDQAFGTLKEDLLELLGEGLEEQLRWADGISTGPTKYGVERRWEEAFRALGAFPEVRAIQKRRVGAYWEIAVRDAGRFGLGTEAAMALCFDIAVQNGGIDFDEEERRIRAGLGGLPGGAERDRRVLIADVVAENSKPEYVEDVRRRKRTVATGEGVVHGARYTTGDWGIAEWPWQS